MARAEAHPIGNGAKWCVHVDGAVYGPAMPSRASARAVAHWLNEGGLDGIEGARARTSGEGKPLPPLSVTPYHKPPRKPDPHGVEQSRRIIEGLKGAGEE